MRILFAAPYTPSKIRARSYNFIKGLRRRDHSLSFIGLADEYTTRETEKELGDYCDFVELYRIPKMRSYFNCFSALFRNMALQSAYTFSRQFKSRIEEISSGRNFDIIHIEHIRAGYSLPKNRDVPAVFDSVDCISSLYKQFSREEKTIPARLLALMEYKKLEKYEPFTLSKYDKVLVTSERDKNALLELSYRHKYRIPGIQVVQNGVDTEFFKPRSLDSEADSIVFSGKMAYHANELAALHFVRDIFPFIKEKKPEVKFYIVGAHPSKKIRQLEDNKSIIVTGWVPDIRDYLERAMVVVCPLRVTVGIQFKLLEAMSMSKPVVTYPEAVDPFPDNREQAYFLKADNSRVFAKNVLKLMNNKSLRLSLGMKARSYMERFFDWGLKVKVLEELYKKVLKSYRDGDQ